jgi:hypothetical protein
MMRDQQVVALLYGDNVATTRAQPGLVFIQKLMGKASMAFLEILILQKKMLEL